MAHHRCRTLILLLRGLVPPFSLSLCLSPPPSLLPLRLTSAPRHPPHPDSREALTPETFHTQAWNLKPEVLNFLILTVLNSDSNYRGRGGYDNPFLRSSYKKSGIIRGGRIPMKELLQEKGATSQSCTPNAGRSCALRPACRTRDRGT